MRTKKSKAQWKMEDEPGMPRLEWAVRRGQPAREKGASEKRVVVPKCRSRVNMRVT